MADCSTAPVVLARNHCSLACILEFSDFLTANSHALAEKDTLFRLRMDWEEMELSSPPKPTRIVDCLMPDSGVEEQIYQRSEQTSPDNASFLEQDGEVNLSPEKIISLPALAGEVAVAQKQQISDLSKKLEVLDKLKVMANAKKTELFEFNNYHLLSIHMLCDKFSLIILFCLRVWTTRKSKITVCNIDL